MSDTTGDVPGRPAGSPSYVQELWRTARVITLASMLTGLAIGALLRVGMLMLRLAQDRAVGVTSDDGFEIGQVTLSGIYDLMVLGVGLGVLGTAAYIAVAPFLIGPRWLRVATVAVTAMLLGGVATIHPDGIDFTVLDTGLAVAVFLVIPFLSGLLVPPTVRWVDRRLDALPQWLLLTPLLVPQAVLVLGVTLLVVTVLLPVRRAVRRPDVAVSLPCVR